MFSSIVFRVLVVTCLLLHAWALPIRRTRNTVSDDRLRDLKKGLGFSKLMLVCRYTFLDIILIKMTIDVSEVI